MVEEGTHPQLLAMLEPVNRRRDEQVALANAKFNYSVQTLYISTKATRAATCSQFNQEIRKLREKCLAEVSETWYQIQRERRASDTLVPGMQNLSRFSVAQDFGQPKLTCRSRIHI